MNFDKLLINHPLFNDVTSRVDDLRRRTNAGERLILPIFGPSRVGKNHAVAALRHSMQSRMDGSRRLMPCLYVKASPRPSLSSLPQSMLQAAGVASFHQRGGPEAKTAAAIDAIRRLGCMVVIVDEFQHFAKGTAHADIADVSDWLKNFFDQTCTSGILIGLPGADRVLQYDEQLAARANAPSHLLPYCWSVPMHRAEFTSALQEVVSALRQSGFGFDPPRDFPAVMATATAGRFGMTVKLLRAACYFASETKTIDRKVLAQAYAEAVKRDEGGLVNPFEREPTEADAFAAYASLMRRSGYDDSFIGRVLTRHGADPVILTRARTDERQEALRNVRKKLAC